MQTVGASPSSCSPRLEEAHRQLQKQQLQEPHELQESPAAAKEAFDDMTQEEIGNAIIDLNSAWANAKQSTTREGKDDLVCIASLLAMAVRKLALMQGMPHEQICRFFFFRLWGKPAMVVPDCLRWKVLSYLGDKDIKATATVCKDGKLIAESYSLLDPLTVEAI
jgi:hypothetical protein